ncbi:MAG: hypothetical protein RL175_236 [Pseudomonadota bacterium]
MCPRKQRPVTARMSADLTWPHHQPAPSERVLFWIYQVATYITFNVIDDAAMLAFVLS